MVVFGLSVSFCGTLCGCGGTQGSSIVSSADNVIGRSVVYGMKGVGEVGELCMCLARAARV